MRFHSIFTGFLFLFVLHAMSLHGQALPQIEKDEDGDTYHCSTEADADCLPCMDTFTLFFYDKVFDIGGILPSWRPVLNKDSVSVLEGKVFHPMISHDDMPIYHYTHDFCFTVKPDEAYKHARGKAIFNKVEKGIQKYDTIIREQVECEWESGLGEANRGNPVSKICRTGNSAGFMTSGHKRYDEIWNWPTEGDWVHVEGLWIWDRGHPPASTEIHPMRMVVIRRNLPESVTVNGNKRFATRIDIYASGDGGAFNNNRSGATWYASYVNPVRMSGKDYVFTVKQLLPRPSANARLKYMVQDRPGHTFTGNVTYKMNEGSNPSVTITIPWKSNAVSDTAVYAQTVFLYWDEGNGVAASYKIHTYKVTLDRLEINRFTEVFARADLRLFADLGGHFIFLNEFVKTSDILRAGMGKTLRRHWKFGNSFTISVAEDSTFRITSRGWEADGVDKSFGHILNMNAPCTDETRQKINAFLFSFKMILGGCLDDPSGEAIIRLTPSVIGKSRSLIIPSEGKNEDDYCPFSKFDLDDMYELYVTIEEIE